MGFLGSIGKSLVNLASTTVSRTTGIALPTFSTAPKTPSAPSDWTAAAEVEAYQGAWFGDRPDLFAKLQTWGNAGVASAKRGVTDLLARGWYGGSLAGDYARATTDGGGTVNIGQGPRRAPSLVNVVAAAVQNAVGTAAAQEGAQVVQRPLGNAPIPTATNYTPLLIGGGVLAVVLVLVLVMRK